MMLALHRWVLVGQVRIPTIKYGIIPFKMVGVKSMMILLGFGKDTCKMGHLVKKD